MVGRVWTPSQVVPLFEDCVHEVERIPGPCASCEKAQHGNPTIHLEDVQSLARAPEFHFGNSPAPFPGFVSEHSTAEAAHALGPLTTFGAGVGGATGAAADFGVAAASAQAGNSSSTSTVS